MTIKIKMEVPDEVPRKFNADLVLEVLQSHRKNGLSNCEIHQKSGVPLRRVREETQKLKEQGVLTEKQCRCHRTPIYHLK